MANLAIRGHATRGKEVIEILEMLGGINPYACKAVRETCFYFIVEGEIDYDEERYITDEYTIFTIEEFIEKFPYKVGDEVQHKGATSCGSVFEVEKMQWVNNDVEYTIKRLYYNNDYTTCTAKDLQPYKEETMEETIIDTIKASKDRYRLFINYQYEIEVDEGEYYVVRRKPQYPKTYEECCKVLGVNPSFDIRMLEDEESALYFKFIDLVRCRNAYWKIAGEQMRLGEPWKPNWAKADERKYCIVNTEGNIARWVQITTNKILAFPTEEMREAFYENFKELINETKELL